jgi:HEAT repeat protein
MHRKLLLILCLAAALPTVSQRDAHAFDWLGRIELEAEGLKSDDPQLRLKAVRSLGRYEIDWTRKHLLGALNDPDVNVRSAAGRLLAKHNVVEAVPTITRWLAESDVQSKQVAADILGEIGAKEGLPALIRSLGDPEPSVRVHAVMALGKIGGESIIVPLVTRLEDDKPSVRQAAVNELRELGDARAVVPLVGLFDDSTLDVRVAAIEAVGFLKDPNAVPALLREFKDSIPLVRIAAVTAMGNLHAKQALPELLVELDRSGSALRGKIAFSLAQIATAYPGEADSQRALTKLVEMLADDGLKNAAKEALLVSGPAAVPKLIDHLNGKIAGNPAIAVELLVLLADKRATPALIAELDRGRISQSIILNALAELGDSRALLPVLALLDNEDPKVRLQAMQTLGPMLDATSEASDVIAEHLGDSDPAIQNLAARFLGQTRSRSAVPKLTALVNDATSPTLRATALVALGQIGDPNSLQVALRILKEGPQSLRSIATDVISEVADPSTAATLMPLATNSKLPYQSLAIEALGAALRGANNERAAETLHTIAKGRRLLPALAATEALAGMHGSAPKNAMLKLAASARPSRKLAALIGLGALQDKRALPLLRQELQGGSHVVSAAAAWSIAEIGDVASMPHLLRACKSTSVATAVNASAGVAMLATKKHQDELASLLLHRTSLVRVNAIMGLARLGDTSRGKKLITMMSSDRSWLVRRAAIRALAMLGLAKDEIAQAAKSEHNAQVRQTALLAGKSVFVPAKRDRWTVFRIVDAKADDKAVAAESRFFVGTDGLATAATSDPRGRIVYEHFAAGPYVTGALSELAGF